MISEDIVVLVNDKNEPLGTAPKLYVHGGNTPLHRGFSVFLFNIRGELLLQQRSRKKKTFPLVWSNSVCGHPKMLESALQAAKRGLKYEIGITDVKVYEILPDFRYTAKQDGVKENELCPVFAAFSNQALKINKEEVENTCWINWNEFLEKIKEKPTKYSSWSVEEATLLSKNPSFNKLLAKYTAKQETI